MSNRHPSGAELQRYVDGELGSLRSHVESCPVCSAEVSAIQQTIAECAQYRESILPGFVPPPRPWVNIYQRFAEVDRKQSAQWFAFSAKGWALVAAMLVLSVGLFLRLREAPTVQAAELLRKAVAAAKAESKPRRIQVRTKTQKFVRPTGTLGASTVKSVQAQFQAVHFDWDNPLTAKAYVAWREQLPEKRDEVIRERDLFRIRTDTSSGDLMTATLTLRVEDLQPVAEHFDFHNQDWVELTEAPDEATPQSEVVFPTHNPGLETRTETRTGPVPVAPHVPATLGDEVRTFAAIHRIGADLGDPVEIGRSSGEVHVTGAGISPQKQQQIRDAVSTLQAVILDFSEPGAPKLQPRNRVAPLGGTNPDITQLQARIAEQIGGREQFDEVAARTLDLSENMMARAYALRRLAEHFPAGSEAELSGEEQLILTGLRRDHLTALRQTMEQMQGVLKPVLSSVSSAAPAGGGLALTGSWQAAMERLFQAARLVDRYAGVMFGNAPDDSPGQSVPTQLLASVADLRTALENK